MEIYKNMEIQLQVGEASSPGDKNKKKYLKWNEFHLLTLTQRGFPPLWEPLVYAELE